MSADQTTADAHNAEVARGRAIQHEATVAWLAYQRLSPAAQQLFTVMKLNAAMGRPTDINPVALARMETRRG